MTYNPKWNNLGTLEDGNSKIQVSDAGNGTVNIIVDGTSVGHYDLDGYNLETGVKVNSISNNPATNNINKLLTAKAIHDLNIAGTSGTSGSSGIDGTSGSSGINGTSGTSASNKIGSGLDNRIARYNGTENIQTSIVTLDDSGNISGINDLSVNSNIYQGDMNYHYFGSDQDAHIFHSGFHFFIFNDTGDMYISANLNIYLRTNSIVRWVIDVDGHFVPDDANTYDIGSTTNEVKDIYQGDSAKHNFGSDQDAYIQHTGSDLNIINGTGTMYITNIANAHIYFKTVDISRWSIQSTGHFIPFAANTYDIGSTTNAIRQIFQGEGYHHFGISSEASIQYTGTDFNIFVRTGNMHIGSNNYSSIYFRTNTTQRWIIESDGHFIPHTADIYNIGSTTHGIQYIYQGDDSIHYFGDDQDAQIYHSGFNFYIYTDRGSMNIGTITGGSHIYFRANDINRWWINGSTGDFLPNAADSYDIGSSSNEVQNIYVARKIYLGPNQTSHIYATGYLEILTSLSVMRLTASESIYFLTNSLARWEIDINGHLYPMSEATVDIGKNGHRLRNIYQGDKCRHNFGLAGHISSDNEDLYIQNQVLNFGYIQLTTKNSIRISTPDLQMLVETSGTTIYNDLTITGNLNVDGTTFVVHNQEVTTSDNIIVVNYGEVGSGVTAGSAGMEVDRGLLTNYQFLFDEATDTFRIGEIGSLQAVATREDSPVNQGLAYWDSTSHSFITSSDLIFTDGILNVGTNISLEDNKKIYFGTDNDAQIYHSGFNFYIYNDTGDMYIGTTTSTDLYLIANNVTEATIDTNGLTLKSGDTVNEISNNFATDTTSALLTAEAIHDLTSGEAGTSGSSGTSGIDGTSGSSGTSGIDGTSGSSGSSGTSGIDGTSGSSGSSGSSGTSGIDGTSGSSGSSGSSGTSASNKIGAGSDNHIARYDGSEDIQTSPVTLDDLGNINGVNDLNIQGNLNVDGTTFVVHNQEVTTTDNIIVVNYGEVGSGVTAGSAGMEVDRGLLTNYQFLFSEATDTFRIGEIGSLQAVATREDNPVDGGIAYWDDASKIFITSSDLVLDGGILDVGIHISLEDDKNIYFGTDDDARIYHNNSHFYMLSDTGNMYIGTTTTNSLGLMTNNIIKWIVDSNGNLSPSNANTYNIGSSSNEVKYIYQGDSGTHYFGSDQDALISHTGAIFNIHNSTGKMYIGNTHSDSIVFMTANALRWSIDSAGHFTPTSTISNDIGSTTLEVRNIYQGDSGYHYFGSDQDARMVHDGLNFYMINDTGNTYINSDSSIYFQTDSVLRWRIDGSGHLTPVGSDTYSIGSGTSEIHNIYQGDSGIHYFGTDQDALIYHNGTGFVISNDTGHAYIGTTTTSGIYLKTNSVNRWFIDGSGHLAPVGSATYNIGSTTSEVRHIYQGDNCYHYFGNDQDTRIYHSGTGLNFRNTTGSMYITNIASAHIYFKTADTYRWSIQSTGHILPYAANTYDIGSTTNEVRHIYQGDGSNHYFGTDQDALVSHSGLVFNVLNGVGEMFVGNLNSADLHFITAFNTRWSVKAAGHFVPKVNNSYDIGTSSLRVRTIYAVNALNTSDYRLKENIKTSDLGLDFISKLNPVKFTFKDFKNDRMRYGLIAQEVNNVLESLDMKYNDFNGLDYDKEEDIWSIGYIEFISPMIKAIQELKHKVEQDQVSITHLELKILNLENIINKL